MVGGSPPQLFYRDSIPPGPEALFYRLTLWGTAPVLPIRYRAASAAAGREADEASIPALLGLMAALPAAIPIVWLATAVAKLLPPAHPAALLPATRASPFWAGRCGYW